MDCKGGSGREGGLLGSTRKLWREMDSVLS